MKLVTAIVLPSAATLLVAQGAQPGGTVEGTVVNSITGAGIDGASVTFFGGPSSRYNATTDAVGHFKITGIAPGNYRTQAEKDGFSGGAPDLAAFLTSPGLLIVSGPDPIRVDLKLAPLGSVAGRVFGPDGKPAVGVEVSLSPNITADMSITDAEGRFALEDIRPGSYTLIARPPESAKPVEAKDGTRTAVVTTYYPSVADQSEAQKIAFSGQADFYEIRMQTAPVHRVRGIVLDEAGKPSSGAEVTLSPAPESTPGSAGLGQRAGGPSFFLMGVRQGSAGVPDSTVESGKDGRFEFPAVRSGDWKIKAVSDLTLVRRRPRVEQSTPLWAGTIWTICKSMLQGPSN
jgi:hypothetical protein